MSGISENRALSVLSVTFQEDCRFTTHLRNKLIKANKFLFILRSRRSYTWAELDYLFQSLVIPNLTYGLSVYGALTHRIMPCYTNLCRTSIERPTSIKRPHAGTPRVAAYGSNFYLLPVLWWATTPICFGFYRCLVYVLQSQFSRSTMSCADLCFTPRKLGLAVRYAPSNP